MPYTDQEEANLKAVRTALDEAAADFGKLATVFSPDIRWTITGRGPAARTFHGMQDLLDNAETALFEHISGPLRVTTKGVWADGDKVFVHMTSAGQAVDGRPYANEYMYILTMESGKAVACTAWLDLQAYYDLVNRPAA